MILELVRAVEIRNRRSPLRLLLESGLRNVAVFSRLLPHGPDDVHVLVDDLVIRESIRFDLLAEDYGRLPVPFEAEGRGDVVAAAPESVSSWCRPVACSFEKVKCVFRRPM